MPSELLSEPPLAHGQSFYEDGQELDVDSGSAPAEVVSLDEPSPNLVADVATSPNLVADVATSPNLVATSPSPNPVAEETRPNAQPECRRQAIIL